MTPLLLPKCALNHFKRLMIEHFYERHLKCFSIKNVCTEFWEAFEIEFPSSSHRVSRYIVGSMADFPIFRSISMVLLVAVWVYAHCIDCIAFHNIVPHRLQQCVTSIRDFVSHRSLITWLSSISFRIFLKNSPFYRTKWIFSGPQARRNLCLLELRPS